MLILAAELELCNETETRNAVELSIEISKNLSRFIEYLKSKI